MQYTPRLKTTCTNLVTEYSNTQTLQEENADEEMPILERINGPEENVSIYP